MAKRKDLYLIVRNALATIAQLEYKDKERGQMESGNTVAGQYYTAALVEVDRIGWQSKQNGIKEGTARVAVNLYTKEGFANHFSGTLDPNDGLAEIELQDLIYEKVEGLTMGNNSQFELVEEGEDETPIANMRKYRMVWEIWVFMEIPTKYTKQNISPSINIANE